MKWRLSKNADHFARHATEDMTTAFLIAFDQVLGLLQRNQKPGTIKTQGMRSYPSQKLPYSTLPVLSGKRVRDCEYNRRRVQAPPGDGESFQPLCNELLV